MSKKTKPKIALDVSQMVYAGHGVARYTEELARALLAYTDDFNFTLYAGALRNRSFFNLRKHQQPWSKANWKLSYLSPRISSLIWNYTNFPFKVMLGEQDLIHTSDWTQPLTQAPTVTTVHDLAFHHYPETIQKNVLKTQTQRLKRAVKFQSHFIADSKSTKDDLVKIYHLDKTKVSVVYPGVSHQFLPQKSNKIKQVKQKYSLPDNYILTLGTREPRKNLTRLIQAHQQLTSQEPLTPTLVIAGRYGWGKDESPADNVIITGFINNLDLPALYSGASVFVYPSLYEGFGFPVLEAMACGVPVVTSNNSSLPEVVGQAGVLIDPLSSQNIAEGIAKALANQTKLAQVSLKQAKQFTWSKTAQNTLAVYQQILK